MSLYRTTSRPRVRRRWAIGVAAAVMAVAGASAAPAMAAGKRGGQAAAILRIARGAMRSNHLRAAIVSLSDPVSKWLPKLPNANQVTLKMLANMTSGYPDYVTDQKFLDALNTDPFHRFTVSERLAYAFSRERSFAPGTNFGYAHTNYVILGEILSKVGHRPLATLLRQNVLTPLHLTNTVGSENSEHPRPGAPRIRFRARAVPGCHTGQPAV